MTSETFGDAVASRACQGARPEVCGCPLQQVPPDTQSNIAASIVARNRTSTSACILASPYPLISGGLSMLEDATRAACKKYLWLALAPLPAHLNVGQNTFEQHIRQHLCKSLRSPVSAWQAKQTKQAKHLKQLGIEYGVHYIPP